MINRKKKLRIYQVILLLTGIILILFTYLKKNDENAEKIISKSLGEKIEKRLKNKEEGSSVFYDVSYSGLDLDGNRYTIIAEEAINSEIDQNIVNMKNVLATFYFKDDTVLKVSSDVGDYNNKNLDIFFRNNVTAFYEGSKLYADKAEFFNSNNLLKITNNVKIEDSRGTMFADELIFDTKNKTLNIASLKDKVIESVINYK